MPDLSKLRICYVAGTLGQGGAERQLFYAVRALRECGAGVRVLTLDAGEFWETPLIQLGASVTCVESGGSRLKRVLRMVKILRQEPADIVQSQHFYTNAYAALAALFCGSNGIGTLRSNGRFDLAQCGQVGGRINLHLPRFLAANSGSSIQYAMRRGVDSTRFYFLPNVVDTERFAPTHEQDESGEASAPVTLLAAGRLTREKRFDRFISIVHGLRVAGFNVRGLIVGSARGSDGLRPELEKQAATLGLLPDGLRFLGSVADMSSIYRQANIYVLTSEHEGTPNVLLEAMAAGLPVVATKVGGVPEIVQDGDTGFLLDAEDLPGQIGLIGRLMRAPDLRARIGRRARTYVEENHSVNRLPAYLDGLYEAASSRSRPAKTDAVAALLPGATQGLARNPFLKHSIKKNEVYEH